MKKYSVALGAFDGVHEGHKKVISLARGGGLVPAAVYFFIPPSASGVEKELLTTDEERCRLFAELGIKEPVSLKFEEVKRLSPEEFFRFLQDRFDPRVICCGFNYRFGKNAAGNTETLKKLCEENGIELRVASPVEIDGETVSSTAIRSRLKAGDPAGAAKMLGRYFSFTGKVVRGDGRGENLGFPTANITYPAEKIKVKPGVYVSRLMVGGKALPAVTNIGKRPTYPCENPPVETYAINSKANFYGKTAKIELILYLRPQKKFASPNELSRAIDNDVKTALDFFENQRN